MTPRLRNFVCPILLTLSVATGCRQVSKWTPPSLPSTVSQHEIPLTSDTTVPASPRRIPPINVERVPHDRNGGAPFSMVQRASYHSDAVSLDDPVSSVGSESDESGSTARAPESATAGPAPPVGPPIAEILPSPQPIAPTDPLVLDDVILSIYNSFPLLESAFYSRDIAMGNHLSAHGGFDLKLKAASENGPLGFYETYRQSVGLLQPLYGGSELWAGYRIGRGEFQPWYLERQTNDGGEFKAGVRIPLLRNRTIDERRAELWRTGLGQQVAEFDIQAQIISFIQEGSYAYWDWVGAGRNYAIASRVLDLASSRTDRIEQQVQAGLIDPPELTDNLRLVATRRAKLADATRKLQQKAAKLSLYLRDPQGQPIVPPPTRLPPFPDPKRIDPQDLPGDVRIALAGRPDLQLIDTVWQQLDIDLEEARNLLQPDVSAVMWGAQDVGAPSSSKRDKSPFQLEAGLYVDVPVQRRKARGKMMAIEAKMQQLMAKRQMTADKISVEVQTAYAALTASFEQVLQARVAVKLAEELAQRERRNFEVGASDMLKVTLREQYAAESAIKEMDALLEYHQARADYRAAIAMDVEPLQAGTNAE